MKKKVYAVLFFTNFNKENSWKLYRIYDNKENAISFCYSLPNFKKEYENFVDPLGTIVFMTNCGMKSPIEHKFMSQEEFDEYKKRYDEYKNKDYPFKNLTYENPKVCVMEIDMFFSEET